MRKRRFKVRGRTRERMIFLLEEDNKTQKVIAWEKEDTGGGEMGNQLRGENGEVKEEEGAMRTLAVSGEDGEAEWVDVEPQDQIDNGNETEETASPKQSLRRLTPKKDPGRLRGKGRRGYWIGRLQQQKKGRIKSAEGATLVMDDSKVPGKDRVKGVEPRAGTGPGSTGTSVLPLEPNQLGKEDC